MAANDTLDLSQLTIDDLKKAIYVPRDKQINQPTLITYQMDEIRKLVNLFHNKFFSFFFIRINLDQRINWCICSRNV